MRNFNDHRNRFRCGVRKFALCLSGILLSVSLFAQEHTVSGEVVDDAGNPISGATIVVPGTRAGAVSDINGKFSIQVPLDGTLAVSFLGYKPQQVEPGNSAAIRIVLELDATGIDDVVVVAYATQKRASVVGAISSMSGKDIQKAPTGDIATALTGRLPGFSTVQQSGQPGGALPDIRIRGQGGVLVIVDGIERQGGSRLGESDAAVGNLSGWETISPQDIESVSILKDASATAVYGVRGANGVIIITTKQGRSGKAQVQYNGSFSLSQPTNLSQTVNSADYIMYNREGNFNDGVISSGDYTFERYNRHRYNYDPILYPSMNMNDYLLREVAHKHEHNVSVRGGDDVVRYYASVGYYGEDGIVKNITGFPMDPNQHYDKLSLRSNLDFTLTKNLTLGINMDVRFENRAGTSSGYGDASATDGRFFQFMYLAKPWITPGFDADGRYIQSFVPEATSPQILESILRSGVYDLKQITANNIINARYDLGNLITKGLSVQAKYSFDFYSFNNAHRLKTGGLGEYFIPMETDGGMAYKKMGEPSVLGYSQLQSGKFKKDYFEASLNYERTFGEHAVTGLLLFNSEKRAYNVGSPADIPRSYLGYVTRLTYGYADKYLAEFNMGINGSENFPKNKRFGIFPAFSVGWVISEEEFMADAKTYVNFLKIRGSHGIVGSDSGGGRFIYIDGVYNYYPHTNDSAGNRNGFYGNFGDQNRIFIKALQEGTVANPNVTWATAAKTNIGLEGNFLKNRLSFIFDYFWEKRKDIITIMQNQPSYLYPSGLADFGNPYQVMANYNRTSTQGFEVSLGWNQHINEFSYYARASYSYAVTTLDRVSEPKYEYPWLYSNGTRSGQVRGLIAEGFWSSWSEINNPDNPYNTFGNNPVPGDLKYKDVNGDMKIDSNDMVEIGYANNYPPSSFALDLGAGWKGLNLSLLFQGSTGMKFMPGDTNKILMGSGKGIFEWISDRWTPTNTDATYPVLHSAAANVESASNFQNSTFWAYDATYVRLKNAVLSYSLPHSVLQGSILSEVTISLMGQNLLTWRKDDRMKMYDPEQVATGRTLYPIMKVYSIGVNLTF